MKVYIILFVIAYIFFEKSYSKGLEPNPFSRGKSCINDGDCNTGAGLTCCGAGNAWGICCPDGLCKICYTTDNTRFQYCGTYCPDFPKTTPEPTTSMYKSSNPNP